MKGPFAFDKEYPNWDSEGNYTPTMETIPKVEYVSIWDFYPDPDARNMSEAEFTIQRHRLNRTQMRALKRRPHFRDESIELAIDYGTNYVRQYWEDSLDESGLVDSIDRYEVLEYWGVLDAELADAADFEIRLSWKIKIKFRSISGFALGKFCGWCSTRSPQRGFHIVPYLTSLIHTRFLALAWPKIWKIPQLLANGFIRMAVDNAALSGNLIFEIDETNLTPGQDMTIYPSKIFRRMAGAPGQHLFHITEEHLSREFDDVRQSPSISG